MALRIDALQIDDADDADAAALAGWHYPGELSFYDMDACPEDRAELLDRVRRAGRYFAARDADDGGLIGFYYVLPRGDRDLELGLGLRPDLVGRGLGLAFTLRGAAFARERSGRDVVTLRVAAFNERARRVYERAGFRETGRVVQVTAGREVEFVCMRCA